MREQQLQWLKRLVSQLNLGGQLRMCWERKRSRLQQ